VRPPEAEAALFQMKDGQVGPLIELTNGFHVIKLVHRDHAGQQPFDERRRRASAKSCVTKPPSVSLNGCSTS